MEVIYNNQQILLLSNVLYGKVLKAEFLRKTDLSADDVYFVQNGKRIEDEDVLTNVKIYAIPRLVGGKGGFGSMLRAIGAQIEKTTNREACRDLSGRRLRDINEEQRLKNWIAAQTEREKKAADRKKKKLERLCQEPKHEFKDENYDKERSALPEKVEDAVEQGLKVASTSAGPKRKQLESKILKKKKQKFWIDGEIEGELSSSDNESDCEKVDPSVLTEASREARKLKSDSERTGTSVSPQSVSEDTKDESESMHSTPEKKESDSQKCEVLESIPEEKPDENSSKRDIFKSPRSVPEEKTEVSDPKRKKSLSPQSTPEKKTDDSDSRKRKSSSPLLSLEEKTDGSEPKRQKSLSPRSTPEKKTDESDEKEELGAKSDDENNKSEQETK